MSEIISKPKPKEVPDYYKRYINSCTGESLLEELENSLHDTLELISTIPAEKENFKYAEGKWTVKEVLLHMTDTERVFGYRAMRLSRRDDTPLPDFKENHYAPNSNSEARSLVSIAGEFKALRTANIELFKGMNNEMLDFVGTANNSKMSTRAIGWMIAGHVKHHCNVLKEKYLTL